MDTSRYSDHLKQVLKVAEELSVKYGVTYVGSEHLLYGMLKVEDCTANFLLGEAGVDPEKYLTYFKRSLNHDSKIIGFTPRTKSIMDDAVKYAVSYAKPQSFAFAGTEHLL